MLDTSWHSPLLLLCFNLIIYLIHCFLSSSMKFINLIKINWNNNIKKQLYFWLLFRTLANLKYVFQMFMWTLTLLLSFIVSQHITVESVLVAICCLKLLKVYLFDRLFEFTQCPNFYLSHSRWHGCEAKLCQVNSG